MKIGLEIHQRLDTTKKLFCNCPPRLIEARQPDKVIRRRLHPVLSELGEIDAAARVEYEKERTFEYYAFKESNCLVDIDEEPPHRMNNEALAIALEIAMHLNAKPVDEVHVMRKIVIDGSNITGFQRTAIIALDGYLETNKGKIGIPTVALEEESAGIVETNEKNVVYRLDRLGIPLVEISTNPDIKDGQHLLEVAEKIGLILRATGKVARGIGTIRQDVNISVEGGARVEIKGAQELKLLPLLVEQEIMRQQNLIKLISELKARFNGKILIERKFFDVTSIFENTNSKLIKNGIANGENVFALRLPHHAGFLGKEIEINRRYGTELSDYAKTAGVKGIIHSDESLDKYGISQHEAESVRKTLNMNNDDAFVLVVANEETAVRALERVAYRAEMVQIPEETRKANQDGSTSYMRPLPGRARLYPETDILPIVITEEMLREIESKKGETFETKKEKLMKILNEEMALKILRSKNLQLFEKFVFTHGFNPVLVANTLENTLVSLRREGVEIPELERNLFDVFLYEKKGTIVKAAIPELLKRIAKGMSIERAIKEGELERISGKELEQIAKENNYDIQKIMEKYRLRVDPAELQKLKKTKE
jgi:glutamyl-tRNA(Gln) amidotransferase subunit E